MKNDEINLDMLENADCKTIERLSTEYKAVSDSDISRLYARSKKLYKNKTFKGTDEYSASVSGVEVYHRTVWKKVLTVAAALVLMGSAVIWAAIFYKDKSDLLRYDGGASSGSIEDQIGSTEEIPYENVLENGKFTMSYDNFTCDSNPLQISGAPYRDAVVAKPFKSVLVGNDMVVAPLNEWLFPVVSGEKYIGFVNCDMRRLFDQDISFWGGQMFAPKLNEFLEKGSIALFDTVDGTYGIYEDNTVIELQTFVPYSGNITFEQVNQGYNLITADSASDIVYGPMSKEWGITLRALDVTPTGMTIECTQSGGKKVHELSTGSYFVIQKFSGGVWEDVEYLPHEDEIGWTSEAWIIQKEATTSWKVKWDMVYGELTSGKYRIGKKIMNLREPGAFNEGFAYAEFMIDNPDNKKDVDLNPNLDLEMAQAIDHSKTEYDINANGQTYGSCVYAASIEKYPDLVAVLGDNGKLGYVYKEEFLGPSMTPEEVEKYMESVNNGTYVPRSFNVYESDGVTVIDTMTEKLS